MKSVVGSDIEHTTVDDWVELRSLELHRKMCPDELSRLLFSELKSAKQRLQYL